tara:strand:+ start:1266 stop:1415 length:150 start_codon:yes stop_codon:yes gene_type:complete
MHPLLNLIIGSGCLSDILKKAVEILLLGAVIEFLFFAPTTFFILGVIDV